MALDTSGESVPPDALVDAMEAGDPVSILDVRNRDEIDAWHVEGPTVETTHVPYAKFVAANVRGDVADLVEPDRAYLVVCPRGEASGEVAGDLRAAGVEAANLEGGLQAWARVYREATLDAGDATLTVHQYRRPASGCLAYAVVDADAGEALVVDPLRTFADRYVADLESWGVDCVGVVDTHVHADHVSGLRAVADATDAPRIVSADAAARGVTDDVERVTDGDELAVGDGTVTVRATPGHTTGSVSLLADGVLLSGDSLFLDGAPRPDLEAGEDAAASMAATLYDTLHERLADLPDDVVVAPGHVVPGRPLDDGGTYTAPLGDLRDRLQVFRTDRDSFVAHVLDSMGDRPANVEDIVAVNLGRADVGADEAFEMELGPNNCAVADD